MSKKMTARQIGQDTVEWLLEADRKGVRRVQKLSWGRLGRIYRAKATSAAARHAISNEARRCGYRLNTILGLNAWD